MTKAFVFGKFLPFHKGHEAMIRYANSISDQVSVLICKSDTEEISALIRKHWIEGACADLPALTVLTYEYRERDLPNTSVAARPVSRLWAKVFKRLLPDAQVLVTSEPYGEMVAEFMNIRHVAFDSARMLFPVSASRINADRISNWHFLPETVKPFYAIKVVILGTESTGKTTLTQRLARHYGCSYVLEAARHIIADSNHFEINDLYRVVDRHTHDIEKACCGDHALVIIDTNVLITESYAEFAFGEKLKVDDTVSRVNQASLYLYLNNDVSYYQDGTRLSKEDRDRLDSSHRLVLTRYGILPAEISGNWEERFRDAVRRIDVLLKKYFHEI